MSIKKATTDYPIQPLLAERWSPYGFADRPMLAADLRSLFEAARWAASSYNEQFQRTDGGDPGDAGDPG